MSYKSVITVPQLLDLFAIVNFHCALLCKVTLEMSGSDTDRVGYFPTINKNEFNNAAKHLSFRTMWGQAISRQRDIVERRRSHSWIQRKNARRNVDPPLPATTMAPRNEAAAKSTKSVKSKSSAVVAVGGTVQKHIKNLRI